MRAAIYARVSSEAQRERHTIENQLRVLPVYVAAQGWSLTATLVDDGRSAKTGKLEARDGFAQLVRLAEAGEIDVVAVVDVDRLTRTEDMRERAAILGVFQAANVSIATPAGGVLDLRTMMGELYVTLQAIFAAEENRKRAERIMAGKARAIAGGRKPAGPTPFGLAYDRATGAWSVHPVNGPLVVEMFQRVAGGESCRAIADDLERRGMSRPRGGMWIKERVWQLVTSRTYVGEWVANKAKKLVVAVPPLITEELWQRVQAALIRHGKRGLRRVRHVYMLEGIAKCGECGAPVGIRSGVRRGATFNATPAAYVCSHRRRPPRGKAPCMAPTAPVVAVDLRLWEAIARELADPALVERVLDLEHRRAADQRDWAVDAQAARDRLTRLERAESGVLRRYRDGAVSEGALDTELAEIRRHRALARQQLAAAQEAQGGITATGARLAALRASAEVLAARVAQASPRERQELFQALAMPGSVVLKGRRVTMTLLVQMEGAGSRDARGAPALAVVQQDTAGYRTAALAHLRIRLVA